MLTWMVSCRRAVALSSPGLRVDRSTITSSTTSVPRPCTHTEEQASLANFECMLLYCSGWGAYPVDLDTGPPRGIAQLPVDVGQGATLALTPAMAKRYMAHYLVLHAPCLGLLISTGWVMG